MENDAEKVESPEEVLDINEADDTDWKAEAIKAQELARRNAGIAKRNATRLEKFKAVKVEAPVEKQVEKKQGFDYAEKAFLKANGIQSDEYELVGEVIGATGKSLDDVLESRYFQAELKERRDAKATKEALPSGTKRSGASPRDSEDYWIAKGELPPKDQKELRRKVVNARMKKQASGHFYDS